MTISRTDPFIDSKNNACWNSRDAWLCIAALTLADFLTVHWLREAAHNYSFWKWVQTLAGIYFTMAIQGVAFLSLAFYFARTKSFLIFCRRVGLGRRVTLFGWCGACLAMGIALFDEYGTHHGWTAASIRPRIGDKFAGGEWFFYVLKSIVIVPFYEEIVLRGFLYTALRGSYGIFASIGLIICFSGYLHWHSIILSAYTSACLVMLWTVLCIVKERTGSFWNCWLCHAAYNAAAFELWLPTIIVVVLIFILLLRSFYIKRKPIS